MGVFSFRQKANVGKSPFAGSGLMQPLSVWAAVISLFSWPPAVPGQVRQQVKVVVEFQQSGSGSDQTLSGPSGIIVTRKGTVRPSGPVRVEDTQKRIQRSQGIFTLVQDGSGSILSVATKVPYREAAFYYDYATGAGYIVSRLAFEEVGTSLVVHASVLPGNQIRVRVTPRISYFSRERSGAIDFTEASTELIVPSGQPIALGGTTSNLHGLSRRILGFDERQSQSETSIVLTATVQ